MAGYLLDDEMQCEDPFLRNYERFLRSSIFHATLKDDWIFDPWLILNAVKKRPVGGLWGQDVHIKRGSEANSQAFKIDPVIFSIRLQQ